MLSSISKGNSGFQSLVTHNYMLSVFYTRVGPTFAAHKWLKPYVRTERFTTAATFHSLKKKK